MAPEVVASTSQQALFRAWTWDSVFVLDIQNSTKHASAVIAKLDCSKFFESSVTLSTRNATLTPSANGGARSSEIWYQFEGFTPNPTASFNNEFWRLTKHMRWTLEERREQRVMIFDADWEEDIGNEFGNLAHWQEFCSLCSIDSIPDTMLDCMEALESTLVNLCDLLDSQRAGSTVVPSGNFEEFCDYIVNGHMYPIKEAREDTFLPTFLKKLNRRRGG
ncbi:hypothetical protein G6011_10764 [Alternaria panax]|uniref:Uncharacterized protein n=1 Tax=Alternaria panax TaxID=48097 RepID=A0AAD4ICF8_9PLEO|nr:hypothetical protein G6011_10764 [Alternaria panax]